jgi:uncharacterized UBP type Zn finger protein
LDVGNSCYFNSVLQVMASLPSFVLAIENTPKNQDHADSSYCSGFMKLFIAAIPSPTLSRSSVLQWASVTARDRRMVQEDWIDFVYRLMTKLDRRYVPSSLSGPGNLLQYVLFIVPGIAQMCTMDSTWTTTPTCGCRMARKEILTEECGLTITVSSNESLVHHIYKIFQPEQVSYYRCDCCGRHSSTEHPAVRQQSLCSLPRFLKINITAPLVSAALPPDYHHHGPLRDYEMLDLSQLTPQPQPRTS